MQSKIKNALSSISKFIVKSIGSPISSRHTLNVSFTLTNANLAFRFQRTGFIKRNIVNLFEIPLVKPGYSTKHSSNGFYKNPKTIRWFSLLLYL